MAGDGWLDGLGQGGGPPPELTPGQKARVAMTPAFEEACRNAGYELTIWEIVAHVFSGAPELRGVQYIFGGPGNHDVVLEDDGLVLRVPAPFGFRSQMEGHSADREGRVMLTFFLPSEA